MLETQLVKRIFINLGCYPHPLGQGLTHPELLQKNKQLKLVDENDKVITTDMWYGKVNDKEIVVSEIILSVISEDPFEAMALIKLKNETFFISYSEDFDVEKSSQISIVQSGDKWIQMSLMQRLMLTGWFEVVKQEGVLWESGIVSEELLSVLDKAMDSA
jgi:hypothetical protein